MGDLKKKEDYMVKLEDEKEIVREKNEDIKYDPIEQLRMYMQLFMEKQKEKKKDEK